MKKYLLTALLCGSSFLFADTSEVARKDKNPTPPVENSAEKSMQPGTTTEEKPAPEKKETPEATQKETPQGY
jgi:hypothetical protein